MKETTSSRYTKRPVRYVYGMVGEREQEGDRSLRVDSDQSGPTMPVVIKLRDTIHNHPVQLKFL